MKMIKLLIPIVAVMLVSFTLIQTKPVLYIIGDSTVKNSDGSGRNGQWGWGTVIDVYFDTNRISIQNHAIGGRSSRTFITDGRWDKILQTLTKGDYVIMQFGHNDSGALDDTARARGTIKGAGNDSIEIYNANKKSFPANFVVSSFKDKLDIDFPYWQPFFAVSLYGHNLSTGKHW